MMSDSKAWVFLVMSGILDVAWALSMKKADGFQNTGWSAVSLLLLTAFVYFLTRALQVLPVGSAYAVWTGIGAAGSAVLGILIFDEPATLMRFFWVVVIVVGTIGLKLSAN